MKYQWQQYFITVPQDEDKNFSFGYSNINSARHEAGNAYTGVTGSYTDGRHTVNYVADVYGFRRI